MPYSIFASAEELRLPGSGLDYERLSPEDEKRLDESPDEDVLFAIVEETESRSSSFLALPALHELALGRSNERRSWNQVALDRKEDDRRAKSAIRVTARYQYWTLQLVRVVVALSILTISALMTLPAYFDVEWLPSGAALPAFAFLIYAFPFLEIHRIDLWRFFYARKNPEDIALAIDYLLLLSPAKVSETQHKLSPLALAPRSSLGLAKEGTGENSREEKDKGRAGNRASPDGKKGKVKSNPFQG